MRQTIRVVIATSVVLLSTAAIAQQMPADVPTPARSITKRPAFVGISAATTTNKIAKFTDTAGTVGETTNLFEASGRLGVGTATPQTGIHIFGTGTQDVFAGMGPDVSGSGTGFNFGYSGATFGIGAGFFNVRPATGGAGVATAP
ncbi:MAG: hypothetical protein ACXV5L_07745, partial [Thermoanaerobaculia bacterium]